MSRTLHEAASASFRRFSGENAGLIGVVPHIKKFFGPIRPILTTLATTIYRRHPTTAQGAPPFVNIRIFISGASGALGNALARQLARPGVHLSLWGRDDGRLEATAQACVNRGAEVATRSLDLSDLNAALAALIEEDEAQFFDLVLLVAGQGDTLAAGQIVEDPLQVARLAHTNFVVPATLAAAIAGRMASRKRGQIALVGTAAAAHSLPFAAGYAGSKAGLARFADALRLAVKPHGVTVTLVSPGFFGPAGTAGHSGSRPGSRPGFRPGEVSVEIVAQKMLKAVAQGRAELVFPWHFGVLRWIDRLLPRFLRDRVLLCLPLP